MKMCLKMKMRTVVILSRKINFNSVIFKELSLLLVRMYKPIKVKKSLLK